MKTLLEAKQETVEKQVRNQFNQLMLAINQLDAEAWSEHYSKDGFLSVFALTDFFASRNSWVDKITSYFSARASQHMDVLQVEVTPLASDVALMTSRQKVEMRLKGGQANKFMHVFTMIWRKEHDAWKIVHSHESWAEEQPK